MTVNDSTKKLVRQRAKFLCEYIEYQETPTHPLLQFAGIINDEEAAQLQSVIH
ncbi:hypothetical protein [Nostoc sp. 'Peltigera membranacea cyanobiont' 210A]|uniref:hypothetical protein n=1 Tax=Nostoc sp. 'Peltigera membranacea cyanobiont' 210A TaxID=2014529 RepID=UPI00167CF8B7|nr:hypothetical protein [Nostoc sp. 'Peltigera membranacea cyanobiont' 210A]